MKVRLPSWSVDHPSSVREASVGCSCQDRAVSTTRQVAKVAAVGGSAALGAVAASAGVIGAQAFNARRAAGPRSTVPPYADGRYGGKHGTSLRLAFIGDSLAAGLGALYPHEAPGALVAERLAQRAGRPVILSTIAVVGSRSDHLAAQVERALIIRPHVAVVVIGGNDITHFRPLRRQVRLMRDAICTLREHDVQVVLGTCPDLGSVRIIGPPARQYARRQSRRLATLQTAAAVSAGAFTVSLGDTLGPEFEARPADLFAADRYHPNAEGYAAMAEVLAPAVLQAAGLELPGLPLRYEPPRTERLLRAAEEAVALPGSVLSPASDVPAGERRAFATIWRRRRSDAQNATADSSPTRRA